jgi:hypothetical protein
LSPDQRMPQAPHVQDLLLGFDARMEPSSLKHRWAPAEQQALLLREDVAVPLSVDYLIWPSAWSLEAQDPKWRGPIQGLWDNVDRLTDCLVATRGCWWIVAIVLEWVSVPEDERVAWKKRAENIQAPADCGAWNVLGYDVADRFLTSSSLGRRPVENFDSFRAQWRPYLNEHHLFGSVDCAMRFRDISDMRVPEHAPHFVYRLLFGGRRDVT